jgi:hypothetical protein
MNATPEVTNPATVTTPLAPVPSAKADEEEKKVKVEHRVSFVLPDGRLVETIVSPERHFAFLVQGVPNPQPYIEEPGKRIEPPYNLEPLCETGLIRFPSCAAPYESPLKLLDEIGAFIRRYADIPDEWVEIISLYILMSWVFDRLHALPYLRFLGEPATGKTRLLQICSSISYKGVTCSGNITGPAMFRTIDMIRGTMALDEADFKNSDEQSDITKVLNNGYMPNFPVVRCNRANFEPESFYVFGPKIISTRHRFEDEATETRCITFETREKKLPAHIPLQLPQSFEREALALRNKLLKYRFDNFHRTNANEKEMRSLSSRSGQTGASLAAVAPNEEWSKKLLAFLSKNDSSRREDSERGVVLHMLHALNERSTDSQIQVKELATLVKDLAIEAGLKELSPKKVGGILDSLGIERTRESRGYFIDLPVKGLPAKK